MRRLPTSWSHYSFYRDSYPLIIALSSSAPVPVLVVAISSLGSLISILGRYSGFRYFSFRLRSVDPRPNAEYYRLRSKRLNASTANDCELHRRRIERARWFSLHRDGPIGGTGSVPARMPASYFCRRFFSGVLLGGGISRKLVENICPAVTWWLRPPGSTLPFPFSFPFNSVRIPSARGSAMVISHCSGAPCDFSRLWSRTFASCVDQATVILITTIDLERKR